MSKKILIFINNFQNGGAEKILIKLSNYLQNKNYEIKLLCINTKGGNILKNNLNKNIEIISLNKSRLLFSLLAIKRIIDLHKPSYIFTSLPHLNLSLLFLKKIFLFDSNIIIREANIIDKMFQENKIKNYIYVIFKRIFYKNAYKIITITDTVKNNLINYQKIPYKNMVTIYNPLFNIDNEKNNCFEKNFEWIVNYKNPILFSVGRLVKQKNFDSLINAFYHLRKNKEIKLILVGDGIYYKRLKKLSVQLKLSNDIYFIKESKNIDFFLKYSSVFISCSLWEGTPNILVEALKSQIPVVCSNFPSAFEILKGTNYKIANRNDPIDLASKINKVLANGNLKNNNVFWKKFSDENLVLYENLLK